MKIIIDARLYGLENTGIGRYTMNLVQELARLDRQNTYTILLREKYFRQLNLPRNWHKVLGEFQHYSLQEQLRLPRILQEEKADLVHFPHFNVPLFINIPFVVTIHDLLMHKSQGREATTLPWYLYKIKRLGYGRVFKNAVSKSRKIIVPTEFVKKELTDAYALPKGKVEVVYEGISKPKIGSLKKIGFPYFIYTGNAYQHKNLERAIKAICLINEDRQQKVVLVIISARNVFVERLEKKVKKLGASEFVKILGFVPDAQLAALYQASLAFLYPSLHEGFGLPGLEAMSAGTLVAASNIPVFKEVYEDKALYFDPLRVDSIKTSLEKVLTMKSEERNALINKSQRFIQKYSWTKMAKETLEVYNMATKDGGL